MFNLKLSGNAHVSPSILREYYFGCNKMVDGDFFHQASNVIPCSSDFEVIVKTPGKILLLWFFHVVPCSLLHSVLTFAFSFWPFLWKNCKPYSPFLKKKSTEEKWKDYLINMSQASDCVHIVTIHLSVPFIKML